MVRRSFLGMLLLSACGVDLAIEPGTLIACGVDETCPDDYACNPDVGRCVSRADSGPLEVSDVAATSSFRVVVTFTKPLDDASASDLGHYSIAPGITVDGARISDDRRVVTLFTSELKARNYDLSVSGVIDAFGYLVTAKVVTFPGIGDVVDPSPPRLIAPRDTDNISQGATTRLQWTPVRNAKAYYVTVALDADFAVPHPSTPAAGYFESAEPELELPITAESAYFWRVTSDVNEGTSEVGRFATVRQEIFVRCPAGLDCAAGPLPPQWEAGTKDAPFFSPARAVTAAARIGTNTVKVASRGTDAYPGGLLLRHTLRLSGGWNADFTERSRAAHPTRLVGSSRVIQVIDNNRSPITIEGFIIEAASTGIMLARCDELVTLRDSAIIMQASGEALAIDTSGAAAAGDTDAPGVPDEYRGPTIEDCDLRGGVAVRATARPIFRRVLFAPAPSERAGSTLTYSGNMLGVIESSYFEDVGIHADLGAAIADMRITDSVISTGSQRAIHVERLEEGTVLIANNLITTRHELQGPINNAVDISGTRNGVGFRLVHNTILTRGDLERSNVVRLSGALAALTNNLLICTGARPGAGIVGDGTDVDIASAEHNAIVGCASSVRHQTDETVTFDYVSEADLATLDGGGTTGRRMLANVVSPLAVADVLQSPGGADANVATLSVNRVVENDWRLRLDPGSTNRDEQLRITRGGKVTTNADCGLYDASIDCGAILVDIDATVRADAPSIGAYESAP